MYYPLKRSEICTPRRAKIVVISLAIFAVVAYTFAIWTSGKTERIFLPSVKRKVMLSQTYVILYTCGVSLCPDGEWVPLFLRGVFVLWGEGGGALSGVSVQEGVSIQERVSIQGISVTETHSPPRRPPQRVVRILLKCILV